MYCFGILFVWGVVGVGAGCWWLSRLFTFACWWGVMPDLKCVGMNGWWWVRAGWFWVGPVLGGLLTVVLRLVLGVVVGRWWGCLGVVYSGRLCDCLVWFVGWVGCHGFGFACGVWFSWVCVGLSWCCWWGWSSSLLVR